MPPEVWDRVRSIFAEAAGLDPDARTRVLEQAGTEERAEVERLLAAHDAPGGLPETARQVPWSLSGGPHELPAETVVSDRFRIVRRIGRGGMGEVYEADDLELGGKVALKTIRPELRDDDELLARFKREVKISRRLAHPHLCRVFDAGRHTLPGGGEVVYLTMELLDGETLAERLERDGPLTPEQAAPLVAQILAALSARCTTPASSTATSSPATS